MNNKQERNKNEEQSSFKDIQKETNLAEEAQDAAVSLEKDAKTAVAEPAIEEKLAEAEDNYLRLAAEFDNYRKRMAKERLELLITAGSDVISGLLPVLDDFERALNALQPMASPETEGIKLIYDKLYAYLQSKGLQQIDALGATMDTDCHEAVANVPAPTPEQKGKVIDEVQHGYTLNGKIIRYAKVVVGS
ncbi:MAG: nucleotide exchange factor GrpE [Prevotellaceae bacterium]|jgi:molecular chaperone GrpE|nr:nucleotide exchange factor GrpE [Prevotellaceae bacterium]